MKLAPEILEAIIEQACDGFSLVTAEGDYIYANRRFCELAGYSHDELLSMTVKDLVPDPEEKLLFSTIVTGNTGSRRGKLLGKDGTTVAVEVSGNPVEIAGKHLILGIFRDLSAINQAEAERDAVHIRYQSLFDNSPVPLWEEDLSEIKTLINHLQEQGVNDLATHFTTHYEAAQKCARLVKILDVNQAALNLHGAASKSELMAGLDKVFTEKSYSIFLDELVALSTGQNRISLEGQVKRFDGTQVDVIITTFLLPGYEENWSRALVSIVDITDLKRLQNHLEEAQRLARLGSWEFDLILNDLWWSPEVYRIFEMDPERFHPTYEGLLNAIHPDDRDQVNQAYSLHIKDDVPFDNIHRLQLINPDGSKRIRYVHECCKTARDAQGRALRSVGTTQDITTQILAEQAAKKQQEKMEHVQRLESLGVLAGGIAHDFNNLLTAIMGHASLARSKPKSGPAVDGHLNAIEETSRRAADLCNQMLAYSGRGKFKVLPLNLSELVDGMVRLLEVSIHKKVLVQYDLAANLPAIMADMAQIQQVIMNLVINANEAIGDNSGSIMLSTGLMNVDQDYLNTLYLQQDIIKPGPHVTLEISDTGKGMDAQTLQRLYEPFFTTKFTGRGLGMSAVQGIVHGHKGVIKVDTEEGKGTTFKVLFPIAEIPAQPLESGSTAPIDHQQGSGLILVVDDEESVRQIAAMILERSGYKTLTAYDGLDALSKLRENVDGVDCVLLDMTMPNLGGEQTFLEMVKIKPGLRVLLSSGYNEQTVTRKLLDKGLAGFIQKPYTRATLLDKVAEIMK